VSLGTEELEVLARIEHERWCAPKWLAGWQVGERDDRLRRHNNLVPFEHLDAETKKYDFDQVKSAIDHFLGLKK
jgi:hypothetical protein